MDEDDEVELTEEEYDALLVRIGERISEILRTTAAETDGQPVATAAALLEKRLDEIEEVSFDTTWCRTALEGLWRGDDVTINLG